MPMSNKKELDASIAATQKGHPFKKCDCGRAIPQSAEYCTECCRLYELGMKFKPTPPIPDASQPQSYPASKHSGFSTTAPSAKVSPKKERV